MRGTTDGKIWFCAPQSEATQTGDLQGVYLDENEKVEWLFDATGNRVIGYVIKTKP